MVCRLHYLEMYGLVSLWRLFRGKKRNVLRGRVDSVEPSIERMVVGTLLLTVLVFLFTTTAVYYATFTLVSSFWLSLPTARRCTTRLPHGGTQTISGMPTAIPFSSSLASFAIAFQIAAPSRSPHYLRFANVGTRD